MPYPDETFALQVDFGAYCRTGTHAPETTNPENIKEYRRLVYGVIYDTLKNAFPLTRKLIGKKRWKKSVKHFTAEHFCQTPQLWKLPFEMYEFYVENDFPFKKKFEFIHELMLYEWLEIEIFMMEDLLPKTLEQSKEIPKDKFIINPEIKILPLKFPVHIKPVKEISESDSSNYFVLFVRNYETKKVEIHDISYHLAEMLMMLNEEPLDFLDLKKHFAKYEQDDEKLVEILEDYLQFSLKNKIILE